MAKPFPYHGVNENLKPHLDAILKGHEYGVAGVTMTHPPTVLDLGANVGAYTYWVLSQLPGAFVFAYEPSPENCAAFKKNITESCGATAQWRLIQGAVTASPTETINLYLSKINTGMNSIHKGMTNTELAEVITVPNYHPNSLPACDIMKIDTEGCELEILRGYLSSHIPPSVISLEFHNRHDYFEIDRLLSRDYVPNTGHFLCPDLGTINYVHNIKCKS